MSILDTIATRLGYVKAPSQYPRMLLAMADAERWSVPSAELPKAQAELYQRLSWVAIAVQFIADAGAGMTFSVKKVQGEDLDDVPNHPFEQLLRRPNPLMSRFELLHGTLAYRALTGNAYWYLNAPRGDSTPPAEVWLLAPHRIKPVPDGRSFISHYEYDPGSGRMINIPTEAIVHFRRFHPLNAFVGLSQIESLATVAQGDLAMQKWNYNFFSKDNAKIPGALAFAEMVNDPDWQRIKADIREDWGGVKRSGPLMLRGSGTAVNWIAMALSQKDMEFLAGRQASKEEIFQVFGVPPGLVDKNATEANAQAAKAVFAEYTLWPLLCSIAEVITNNLLKRYGDQFVGEFDDPRKTDRLIDLQEQQEFARTHTIDEIRSEYYEDKPLGDERGKALPAEIAAHVITPEGAQPQPPQLAGPEAAEEQPPEEPAETEPKETTEESDELMKANLARWRTKCSKRGKMTPFDSEHIPAHVKAAVQAVGFDWVARWDALKKKREPDRALEEKLRKRIAAILSANGKNWVSAINDKRAPDLGPAMAELHAELATVLSKAALEEATAQAVLHGIAFDIAEINAAALEWARGYSYELVTRLTDTTRNVISGAVQQFIDTPGMTIGQISDLIAAAVGDARASMIAITETTRAYSAGTRVYQEMLKETGIMMRRIWNTSADEKVCVICEPLNGKPEDDWRDFGDPPGHVNCRCWTTLEYVKR